jgi:preprotein translocase subunit SecY
VPAGFLTCSGGAPPGDHRALGIMPYISASIILQLLTVVVPTSPLAKGERGRKRSSGTPATARSGSV